MKYHNILGLVLLTLTLVVLASASAADRSGQYQLPRLFDFKNYRETYNKVYGSIVEELARKKYMLARAFRAFVSGIRYKHGQLNYHLAVNHLSDRSPQELDRMDNPSIGSSLYDQWLNGASKTVSPAPKLEQDIPEISANNATIENLMDNIESLRLRDQLEADNSSDQSVRELKLGELIETSNDLLTAEPGQISPSSQSVSREKTDLAPLGNEPYYYKDPKVVMNSTRARLVQKIQWHLVAEPKPGLDADGCLAYFRQLAREFSSLFKWRRPQQRTTGGDGKRLEPLALPDEVFFDHRDSNCLLPTRDQGYCGSCYAFVGVALAEWLHCRQTGGKLVAFSEQYLVDCGEPVGLYGCHGGGSLFGIGDFIHNYGLELARDYPYVGYQDECPYADDTDPKRMGRVRMRLGAGAIIPVSSFEQYLRYSPIMVAINRAPGFKEYGRGVFSGSGCEGQGVHAVLLVGHGRENGEEYWLLRNSYRPYWGERGHMKLSKRSSCIEPPVGAVYGTEDAFSYSQIKISTRTGP